jgi:isocitrate dehydrogenase kinase/phosphatase
LQRSSDIRIIAKIILGGFKKYLSEFLIITRRSKVRFEKKEWQDIRKDAVERLNLYEKILTEISKRINDFLVNQGNNSSTWVSVKGQYADLIKNYCNRNIAETFFNSLTRKRFGFVGVNRDLEFFHLHAVGQKEPCGPLIYKTYPKQQSTKNLLQEIIDDHHFEVEFDNLSRDLDFAVNELNLFLWPIVRNEKSYSLDVLKSTFYRNKVAYIIGRIVVDSRTIPLIIPVYNGDSGIYIDSVLLDEADANNIFGFAYSYFNVDVDLPNQLINFLSSILPQKPLSDLFNSIGFNKHGKTEFYRDLHRFVHISKEKFEYAPGKEGAVMLVFTLPNYNHVFKVIKDKPCFVRSSHMTDKTITKDQVMERYDFVCKRDRVGRLVDTQEFENLRFRIKRFSDELLSDCKKIATDAVIINNDYVVINHLYLQRKVIPLPIYFNKELNINLIRQVIIDFGYFIKDLAATGLFPADLFNTWNYGVSEGNRVVLYDYDDIIPLENSNFKLKPVPKNEYEEHSLEEDWIIADQNDFFLDEVDRYIGIPEPLKGIFNSVHSDLFTVKFWNNIKSKVMSGEVIDIIPYARTKRFKIFSREA